MTAATAVNVDEIDVETVECKFGKVVLTTTPDGWEILGVHKTRTFKGTPAVYRLTVTRCDCRTNPDSPLRVGVRSSRYHSGSNVGTRELCIKQPEHNSNCHNKRDHCRSLGHETKLRALFTDAVKSYQRDARQTVNAQLASIAGGHGGNGRLSDQGRAEYLAWLQENDPTATNPYA
jgi:hypothetical protein